MPTYPTCLIFSGPEDIHVTAVLEHLSASTLSYILDFREYARSFGASLRLHGPRHALRSVGGQTVSFERLETVWWRRPQQIHCEPPDDPTIASFVDEEYLRFWQSFLASIAPMPAVRWYNPYKKNEVADCKFRQLEIAAEVGFRVPDTLVTNLYEEARGFVEGHDHRVIFKSFASNNAFWQPTRKYEKGYEDLLREHLGYCPVIFQEYIEGRYDYRIIVVDERISAVRFDVGSSRYPYDVRIDTGNQASACALSGDVQRMLLAYMHKAELRYGAFDCREARDGTMTFFEVNPAGQFLYLDQLAGTTVAQSMAEALSSAGTGRARDLAGGADRQTAFERGSRTPFAAAVPERVRHIT
jgi:hypothetical protein